MLLLDCGEWLRAHNKTLDELLKELTSERIIHVPEKEAQSDESNL